MISHRQIYGKLKEEFNDGPSRVMSETLIELVEHQDEKFIESMNRMVSSFKDQMASFESRIDGRMNSFEARMDSFEARMASKEDLHREINSLTWRIITAMIAWGSIVSSATYFIIQQTK